jgi:hypothetical protein
LSCCKIFCWTDFNRRFLRKGENVSVSVNCVVMITSDAFVRRFSFSCEKYMVQVRTCPTKSACCAYYGEVREMHGTAPESIYACHPSVWIQSQTGFVTSYPVPNLQQKTLWWRLNMMYHVQQVGTHRFFCLRNWALCVSFVWQQK